MSSGEVLVSVEHVSKKYCRSLKRSLWYGVQDIARSLAIGGGQQDRNDEISLSPEETALRRDEFWAVRNISFAVRRGECLGLIGHNGAGKSTLLKMLNSLNRPDCGRITLKGRVGALIELNAGFNPVLTGRENVFNQAALLGFTLMETEAKFDMIVDFAELDDFIDMPVQNYSSGMRVRLGFAVAAQMEPDILLVDEVLAVGDAKFRHKCINAMMKQMESTAVIFVSHSMPQVQRVCNKILHLDHGQAEYYGEKVSEGVAHYLSRVSIPGVEMRGDGDIVIKDIRLSSVRDATGSDPAVEVDQNGQLDIDFQVISNRPKSPMVVHVLFWNLEMIPALEILYDRAKGLRIEGSSRVSLRIDSLPLGPGKYSISLIVMQEDLQRTFLHLANAASVTVVGPSISAALCLQQGQWAESAPPGLAGSQPDADLE